MIRILITLTLAAFAGAAVAEEDIQPDELWNCYAPSDENKQKVIIYLYWHQLPGEKHGLGIGAVEFSNSGAAGHTAMFELLGLNRRWRFGVSDAGDAFQYSFVIRPDGTGLYYDFTTSKDGSALPSQVYDCVQD